MQAHFNGVIIEAIDFKVTTDIGWDDEVLDLTILNGPMDFTIDFPITGDMQRLMDLILGRFGHDDRKRTSPHGDPLGFEALGTVASAW